MKRIQRITPFEADELRQFLTKYYAEDLLEDLLNELPSHLFGIALDYGFNDTEVRDWFYFEVMRLKEE